MHKQYLIQNWYYKLCLFLLEILLFFSLQFYYKNILSTLFDYMGYSADYIRDDYIYVYLMVFGLITLGMFIFDELVYSIYHFLLIILSFGHSIHFIFDTESRLSVLLPVYGVVLSVYLLQFLDFKKYTVVVNPSISNKNLDQKLELLFSLCIILALPFLVYVNNINFKNLLLIDVYSTRLHFREISSTYLNYSKSLLSRVLLPLLVIFSLERKRKIILSISISIILYIYLCGALKSIFIGIIVVILFYFGSFYVKPIVLSSLYIFVTIISLLFKSSLPVVLFFEGFIRRILFVPPKLENIFHVFYEDNFTFGSHLSILGNRLIPSTWFSTNFIADIPPSVYIGENVIGKVGLNANVGLLTESYFSFGIIGILYAILFIFIFFAFFKYLNINSKYFGFIVVYIYYINTSLFFPLMITHGLIFLVIFFIVFKDNISKHEIKII